MKVRRDMLAVVDSALAEHQAREKLAREEE
jgi:hypothetical protein